MPVRRHAEQIVAASNRQMKALSHLPAFELRRCCFADASLAPNTRRFTLGRSVVSTLDARRAGGSMMKTSPSTSLSTSAPQSPAVFRSARKLVESTIRCRFSDVRPQAESETPQATLDLRRRLGDNTPTSTTPQALYHWTLADQFEDLNRSPPVSYWCGERPLHELPAAALK